MNIVNELPRTLRGFLSSEVVRQIELATTLDGSHVGKPYLIGRTIHQDGDDFAGISKREWQLFKHPLAFPQHMYDEDVTKYYEVHRLNNETYIVPEYYAEYTSLLMAAW